MTSFAVPQNEWTHVAAVHRAGEPLRLYINGALAATSAVAATAFTDAPSPFVAIGALISLDGDDFNLTGDVDEASAYTRALTAAEIQSIFSAGVGGKTRLAPTAAGTGVTSTVRDATLTFSEVQASGDARQTPLDPATLPALPASFVHTGLAYEVSTDAVYTGNISFCLNLPALAGERFSRLRVLQRVGDGWVNRTAAVNSPQLCGQISNQSAFAVVEQVAPTSAAVSVGGRVLTASGRGVSQTRITLTDSAGAARTAVTNQFGYYRFTAVPAGATYVLTAKSKQYAFTPETMILNVDGELTSVDFTARE